MVKFNKDFSLKIVSITVTISLLSSNILYAYPLSKDSIRVPVGQKTTLERMMLSQQQAVAGQNEYPAWIPSFRARKSGIYERWLAYGFVGLFSLMTVMMTAMMLSAEEQAKPPELHEQVSDLGEVLSWNIKIEKPTIYQLNQIKTMQDKIVEEARQKLFPTTIDLLKFINSSIDSNFCR